MNDQNDSEEEIVFEFYEDDISDPIKIDRRKVLEEYNSIDFEEELNPEQLAVVNNISGPMLIIAGAGSGKTRTIVYSVARLLLDGVYPDEIMLVTFTNKAAKEMINRVEVLLGKKPRGIWAGTFHSLANRFLRKYAKILGLKTNYTIMDQADAKGLMKISIGEANVEELEERFPTARMTKDILSYSINCDKTLKGVLEWKYPQFLDDNVIKKLKKVIQIYEKKKAKDGLVDFDDLLVYWNEMLKNKGIAKRIAKSIRYILVDEYQDTNHIQAEIIHKIVSQNPEKNVLAVGDDAQSIYAFRGADFTNIMEFQNQYEDCSVYRITYNYRSVPEILKLANDSIKHNKKQYQKDMKPTRQEGLKPFQVSVADDEDQAKFIAKQVLKLRSEGFDLHEIAVLYRAGHHSFKVELELQKKNIPYEVRSGVSFFEKAHIKDLLAHLNVLENPYDEISWSRIFTMIQGLGGTSAAKIYAGMSSSKNPIKSILEKNFFSKNLKGKRIPSVGWKNLKKHVKRFADFSTQDSPSETIKRIIALISEYIKSKYSDWQERIEDLQQLTTYADQYDSIQRFLETLSLNASQISSKTVKFGSKKEEEKPMILSTIHRAKGLEWRVVFIPMLCENFFPSSQVIGDKQSLEEERRVFYVAITRAKDHLYLITPSLVAGFGGVETARISQFVDELDSEFYKKASVKFKSRRNKYSNSYRRDNRKNRRTKPTASFTSAKDLYKNK